jgi:glycosyltransferase involved in cell wall biosynthesis
MLGGAIHSKGADVFISAIPDVLQTDNKVHFVIVGYPPLKTIDINGTDNKMDMGQKCLQLITNLKLEKKVSFIGLRNDIPHILASSHLLIWPATVPHFSRPIIEAQAMGIPPIGTNFEVTKEVIEEGETGLTFENGDAASLAHQINRLLSDTQLYKKISQQAYQLARERFSADTNVKKIINIYQSLV